MQKIFDNETEYFIYVITCALNGTQPDAPKGEIDWKKFVSLSKEQEAYSIIACALPSEYLPEDEARNLNNYSKSELVKTIAMNSERLRLEGELEKLGISFMLLKGSRIKEFYPRESMRQMSDNDILYDVSKRDELLAMMKKQGYTLYSWSENSDDFNKKPYYTFEFHRELFFDEYGFYPDFSFVWDNAGQDSENSCKRIMSNEDLYLHCIAHMYKHNILGGFGIRFLCDLYLIFIKGNLDFNYVSTRLDEMGLLDFEKSVRELSLAIFEGRDFTEKEIDFLNHTMKFGIFGEADFGTKLKFESFEKEYGTTSLFRYALLRLFPKKEYMLRTYPALNKKPYLLAYYYIKRLVTKTVSDGGRAAREMKKVKKIKEEKDS